MILFYLESALKKNLMIIEKPNDYRNKSVFCSFGLYSLSP